MENINLASVCTRNSDGSINIEDTVTRFTNLVTTLAERETYLRETISVAVTTVFDSWGEKPLVMPTLCALAVQHMSVKSEDYTEAIMAVKMFVNSNIDSFKSARGKGGGVRRLDK